jgi:hypothetical protein
VAFSIVLAYQLGRTDADIDTVHERRAPMIPISTSLRL